LKQSKCTPSEWSLKNKRVALLLRGALGLLFLYASFSKALDPFGFSKVIFNYQILPELAIYPVAALLPYLEICIGLCLIFGIAKKGAALLAFLSMGAFSIAIILNLIRGINVDCGCFDVEIASVSRSEMYWYVFRDLLILFWTFIVLRQSFSEDQDQLRHHKT